MNVIQIILITTLSLLTINKTREQKTIELDYGFKVTVGQGEDFGNFKTYMSFELSKNGKLIFADNPLIEYEFRDKFYPLITKIDSDKYELLFEVNDRPNKNYLKRLLVQKTLIVKEDKLPTFVAKPKDVDNDGIEEYAGFWDYAQRWGENYSLTAYNPIIYYSITKDGLQLDSTLTIKKNKEIYGGFHGFSFSEDVEQPVKVLENFKNEIEKLKQ